MKIVKIPELPEVARTALNLNQRLSNQEITDVKIHSGRYKKHGPFSGYSELLLDLPAKVESVKFYGKLIIFTLKGKSNQNWFIWNTLGMSGGWRDYQSKHGNVELVISNESLYFTDTRNFGTLKVTNSLDLTNKKIKTLGPNHLNDTITDEIFKNKLIKKPNKTLAEVLMNQSIISGIGNYIKAEVLYAAKLSPHRKVMSLSDLDFSNLNQACYEVIQKSFNFRGASFRSYVGLEEESSDFSFQFKVYGRLTCEKNYPVKREITLDKRTTWWVPELQV